MGHRHLSAPLLLAIGGLLLSACSLLVAEDAVCGDGVVEAPEECDRNDFGNLNELGCSGLGYDGGNLICTPYCRIETWNCHNNNCGDGDCDYDENHDTCPQDCPDPPVCGDGKCDPTDSVTCEDCDDVRCGDGYCARLTEDASCEDDCGSAFFCGDQVCQLWEREMGGCEEDCPEGICDDDGVCEPDLNEPENQCDDCWGLPQCGDAICNAPAENEHNCPFDCTEPFCGDNLVQPGEACDGETVSGTCKDLQSRAGTYYDGGTLRCSTYCQLDTWECSPKDLGARCEIDDECRQGLYFTATCLIGGSGIGMCTLACPVEVEGTPCGPTGASCHDVNGSGDFFCLWPCQELDVGVNDCAPGLRCSEFPMSSGDYFCNPPD